MARPLDEDEKRYIERHYANKGRAWVARKLDRAETTVYLHARNNGISCLDPPADTVALIDLALELGMTRGALWARADAEGVLRRRGVRRDRARVTGVPKWWADEQRARRPVDHEAELAAAGWWGAEEAADYLGVNIATVRKALRGDVGLGRFFEGADVRFATAAGPGGPKYMLLPEDVERARRRMQDEQRQAAECVSVAALAAELGVADRTIQRRMRARQVAGRMLLGADLYTRLYLTPAEAERVAGRVVSKEAA